MSAVVAALPDGWTRTTLGSVLTGPRDLTYGIVQPGAHDPEGVPIVRVTDVRNGRVALESPLRVEATVAAPFKRSQLQGGELLITLVGTVGECAVAPNLLRGWNTARAVGVARVRPDVGADWVALCLRSREVQDRIAARVNTTVQATLNLNDVRELPIVLPLAAELHRIRMFVAALDDRIESNRRQALLIGALFAAEFLALTNDCRTRTRLDSVATFTKGASYRSAELTSAGDTSLVTLKSVGRHGGYQPKGLKPYIGRPKPEQVVQPRELVIAQTDLTQAADVMGRVVRVPAELSAGRLVASLDLVIVRSRGPMPVEFLYGVLLEDRFREHCRSRSSGTTVLHLSRDALPQYQAPAVALKEQQRFAALSRPLLDRQDALGRESVRLAALRDALLPELLSGRIRVPEASEAVESALA